MNVKKGPFIKLKKGPKSAICVAFLLMLTTLSLNFFAKPAACPMYAGGVMATQGCECCAMHRGIAGDDGKTPGRFPKMCCRCGMCHVTAGGVLASGPYGARIYLQLQTVSFVPRFSPRHLAEYSTDSVFFLLGREKDRPPEAS